MDKETKVCNKCGIEKPIDEYWKYKRYGKEYTHTACKECLKKQHKEYHDKNIEKIKLKKKEYAINNKEHIKQYKKEYYEKHKEEISKKGKLNYQKNKDYINKRNKKWVENNKEKVLKYQKEYRKNNAERISIVCKEYRNKHKERKKEIDRKYYEEHKNNIDFILKKKEKQKEYSERNRNKIRERNKKRYNEDNIYRLKQQIRHLINQSFKRKGHKKGTKTEKIIGCCYNELMEHLLQTFKSNYGYEWDRVEPVHIDHIIPLATAKTEEDIIKLCHYTNLQLLKAKDNLRKNAKNDWRLDDVK